jgi:hypothetical protein
MTTQTPSRTQITTFTPEQQRILEALRRQYHQDRDFFTVRERAHLRFLRWLYHSGRLTP